MNTSEVRREGSPRRLLGTREGVHRVVQPTVDWATPLLLVGIFLLLYFIRGLIMKNKRI